MSEDIHIDITLSVCPFLYSSNVYYNYSDSKSHILTVLSLLPDIIILSLDEKQTDKTESVWPLNVFINCPYSISDILIVLSLRPYTIILLSDDKSIE